MQATGRIIETRILNAFGGIERYEYKWRGGEIAELSWLYLHFPVRKSVFTLGPYRLRVIDEDLCRALLLVMRDGWKARLYQIAYRLSHVSEFAYRRFILTLAVWGLARYVQGSIPSWKDVHLLRMVLSGRYFGRR